MKKILEKIFIIIWLFLAFSGKVFWNNTELLNKIKWWDSSNEINIWNDPKDFILSLAENLINVFLIIAIIYFFIIVIKLLVSWNAEEESSNFKKWFIWISLGIMVMQMAKVFVRSITTTEEIETSTSSILPNLANILLNDIISPLTRLLETWASFLFVLIWIYAFFTIITSSWDEEKAKNWRMTIFYAICWFIIIKVSAVLVKAVYWECKWVNLTTILTRSCAHTANISETTNIITTIINWINSFVWIWIVIMVIYTWLQIIFSKWDEEKLNNGKKTLLYIVIGVWILIANYLILTFFL